MGEITKQPSALRAALEALDPEKVREDYSALAEYVNSFGDEKVLDKELGDLPALRQAIPHVVADGENFDKGLDAVLEEQGLTRADSYVYGFTAAMLLLRDLVDDQERYPAVGKQATAAAPNVS